MKNWAAGIVVVCALAGAAAGWATYSYRLERQQTQARAQHLVFAGLKPEKIGDMAFLGEEKLRLLRKTDGWRIIEPINVRADDPAVQQTVELLAGLKYRKALPQIKREYQLEPYLEFATNRKRYSLSLGAATDAGRYIASDGQAYLVADQQLFRHHPKLDDLRSRRLSRMDPAAISAIRIVGADVNIHLEKSDGWHVSGQAWRRIDPYKVQALISGLVGGEAIKFESEIQGREPDVMVEFSARSGESEVFRLWFGWPVFAEAPAVSGVVELDPYLMKLIPDSVGDLLDRSLVRPQADRIECIRLSAGKERLLIIRSQEGFAAGGVSVNPAKLGNLFAKLRRLEGEPHAVDRNAGAKVTDRVILYYYKRKLAFDIRIYSNYYLALNGTTYRVRHQDLKALQASIDDLIKDHSGVNE